MVITSFLHLVQASRACVVYALQLSKMAGKRKRRENRSSEQKLKKQKTKSNNENTTYSTSSSQASTSLYQTDLTLPLVSAIQPHIQVVITKEREAAVDDAFTTDIHGPELDEEIARRFDDLFRSEGRDGYPNLFRLVRQFIKDSKLDARILSKINVNEFIMGTSTNRYDILESDLQQKIVGRTDLDAENELSKCKTTDLIELSQADLDLVLPTLADDTTRQDKSLSFDHAAWSSKLSNWAREFKEKYGSFTVDMEISASNENNFCEYTPLQPSYANKSIQVGSEQESVNTPDLIILEEMYKRIELQRISTSDSHVLPPDLLDFVSEQDNVSSFENNFSQLSVSTPLYNVMEPSGCPVPNTANLSNDEIFTILETTNTSDKVDLNILQEVVSEVHSDPPHDACQQDSSLATNSSPNNFNKVPTALVTKTLRSSGKELDEYKSIALRYDTEVLSQESSDYSCKQYVSSFDSNLAELGSFTSLLKVMRPVTCGSPVQNTTTLTRNEISSILETSDRVGLNVLQEDVSTVDVEVQPDPLNAAQTSSKEESLPSNESTTSNKSMDKSSALYKKIPSNNQIRQDDNILSVTGSSYLAIEVDRMEIPSDKENIPSVTGSSDLSNEVDRIDISSDNEIHDNENILAVTGSSDLFNDVDQLVMKNISSAENETDKRGSISKNCGKQLSPEDDSRQNVLSSKENEIVHDNVNMPSVSGSSNLSNAVDELLMKTVTRSKNELDRQENSDTSFEAFSQGISNKSSRQDVTSSGNRISTDTSHHFDDSYNRLAVDIEPNSAVSVDVVGNSCNLSTKIDSNRLSKTVNNMDVELEKMIDTDIIIDLTEMSDTDDECFSPTSAIRQGFMDKSFFSRQSRDKYTNFLPNKYKGILSVQETAFNRHNNAATQSLGDHLIKISDVLDRGLDDYTRLKLLNIYPINPILKGLKLNVDIHTRLPRKIARQDNDLYMLQNFLSRVISALEIPYQELMGHRGIGNANPFILVDIVKILADVQHSLSLHRRKLINPHLQENVLQNMQQKPGFLYGGHTTENIKASETKSETPDDNP